MFIKKVIHLLQRAVKELLCFSNNIKMFGLKVSWHIVINHVFLLPRNKKYMDVIYRFAEQTLWPVVEQYRAGIIPQKASPKHQISKVPVWICWFQGEENMPELVQICYESVKKNLPEYTEIHVITLNNLSNYIDIDYRIQQLFENGKMSFALYSDVIRYLLLANYGGIWLDATILVTDNIPSQWFESDYFTMRMHEELCPREPCKGKWTNFCFSGKRDCIVFSFVRSALSYYYQQKDQIPDYIFLDYILMVGYKNIPEMKNLIDSVPYNNEYVWGMIRELDNLYDERKYDQITQQNYLHKLSYQKEWKKVNSEGNLTTYGYLTEKY